MQPAVSFSSIYFYLFLPNISSGTITFFIPAGKTILLTTQITMKRIFNYIIMPSFLIFTSCHPEKHEEERATQFLVTSPLKKDTTVTTNYVCQIHSIQHIELRALERGYLQEIFVDEGKFVKNGQLLFKIMPLMYQAELEKAEAEAEFAQIEFQNTKNLADSGIVSPNELALAQARLNKANAEKSLAQVHLGFTEIRAPFDGIIDKFYVRRGSLLDEGDLLTTLSDNSKMWVYFNVPEAEYLNYQQHSRDKKLKKVGLVLANQELFPHQGIVETIEADFNNETGNIAFRATFPNPDRLLRHGETGNIQMVVPLKQALIIPQKATYEILQKKYVFVVGPDSIVHSREIKVTASIPDLYIINSGLKERDRILLEGIRKVRDGQKIGYQYRNSEQVITSLKVYTE